MLDRCDDAYYNDATSLIPDHQYDGLKDQLRKLAPNHPRLKKIGHPVGVTEWKKAKHKISMTSLEKVNSEDEFRKWASQTGTKWFVIEDKLDGFSINEEYSQGQLQKAITRGDGKMGENIYENARRMKNVKQKLSTITGSIRGEAFLLGKDFDKINSILKSENSKLLKNCRNGATGTAKRFDGRFSECLTVYNYDIECDDGNFKAESEKMEYLEDLGLQVCFWKRVTVDEAVEVFREYEKERRAKLAYEIDGLVIKVDDLATQKALGKIGDNPKGQIAWKFESIKAVATVINIEWSLGRNRRITPIIHIEPTTIGGVTVRKMNCHNVSIFQKMGLYKGCKLLFERANDVIPAPIKVIQ